VRNAETVVVIKRNKTVMISKEYLKYLIRSIFCKLITFLEVIFRFIINSVFSSLLRENCHYQKNYITIFSVISLL
jgi:hypothetical protein